MKGMGGALETHAGRDVRQEDTKLYLENEGKKFTKSAQKAVKEVKRERENSSPWAENEREKTPQQI